MNVSSNTAEGCNKALHWGVTAVYLCDQLLLWIPGTAPDAIGFQAIRDRNKSKPGCP